VCVVCVCVCVYSVRVCVCVYGVRLCVCVYSVRVCVCVYGVRLCVCVCIVCVCVCVYGVRVCVCYSSRSQLQLAVEFSTGRRVGLDQELVTNVQGLGDDVVGWGWGVGPSFLSKGRMCWCGQEIYS